MRAPLRPRQLLVLFLVGVLSLAGSGTHVIRAGDTLGSLASRHGMSVRDLAARNGIADPDLILAGQRVQIPGGANSASGGAVTHRVRPGETLGGIARRHGTSVRALMSANGIDDPDRIRIGAALRLPTTGSGSTSPATSGRGLAEQRHTVARGDTVAGIARRYGLSVNDLISWNGIVGGRIYAGARLVLFDPGPIPGRAASSGEQRHRVADGDTLGRIAVRYGVSASSIVRASGVSDPNRIRVGQLLTIPAGGAREFACPVPGGSYINDWGFPRSGGRAHAGNDLFAPRGTPVHAPTSGTVAIAEGRIGGKQFRLTASDGTLWFGSHLDRFGASGQVRAGDVIGYVGDSGNARGSRPHLHFEIHTRGRAVNPYPWLRANC